MGGRIPVPLAKLQAGFRRFIHAISGPANDAAPQLIVVARLWISAPLMVASFRERFTIRVVTGPEDAATLLRKSPAAAVIHDWDVHPAWRELCGVCAELGIPFCLAANAPGDDLFLEVAAAGGSCVLWKPLQASQVLREITLTKPSSRNYLTCGMASSSPFR